MTELTLMPDGVFRLLLSILTGGLASVWLIHDLVMLVRLPRAGRRDPLLGDRRFGYLVGIVIASIGVYGTARFNGFL
jgi:hypothetical protein